MPPIFWVYILSSARRILYVGVTRDLRRRLVEHRTRFHPRCFTARYNIFSLVHVETFPTPRAAIEREKQIKAYGRAKKLAMIERSNAAWRDLAPGVPDGWARRLGGGRRDGNGGGR